MGNIISSARSLLPYHLLVYGTLLGTTLYQSIVMTKLCYLVLSRPEFMNIQKRVFPVYFQLQFVLSLLTAATLPTRSFASFAKRPFDSIPLGIMLLMSVLNWFVYGPKTTAAMLRKAEQVQAQDVLVDVASEVVGEGLRVASKQFARQHAMSIHLNAIFMVATVAYGFVLASRLSVKYD